MPDLQQGSVSSSLCGQGNGKHGMEDRRWLHLMIRSIPWMVNARAPSPLSASAFYRMQITLLVIYAATPCWGTPLSKTLQSLSQPCPGHKKKNGLNSRLLPKASRVLDSPSKRQNFRFQNRRVLYTVCWILHLPPDVWQDAHAQVVQHTTASALNNREATATFLLLPN